MNRRIFQQMRVWGWVSLFLLLALAACTGPQEPLPAGVLAGSVNTGTAVETRATPALEEPLVWQGYSMFGDGNAETCKGLRMSANGEVEIGSCDGSGDTLIFPGQAELDSPAWQRAIATWVEFTYGQQTTGQMGAATRTVMSWWLGELPDQPGNCRHLLVLAYGYAYANVDPCEGGQVVSTAEGWLQTAELDPFDAWLYNRAPLYADNQYFEGSGAQAMTDAEIAQMAQWAEAVYNRLAEQITDVTAPGSETALVWEGYTTMGSVDGEESCVHLALTANNEATFGPCGAAGVDAELLPIQAETWAQIQEQFASFVLESAETQLLFQGKGEVADPVWQRALATWAEFTFAALSTGNVGGNVGTSNRTAMSWWLGEVEGQAGVCEHLVVLNHGYAYADTLPCAGGETLSHVERWLATAEMAQFDAWLYTHAPTYQGDNYLDGRGEDAMTEAQIDEVAQWAASVYARLTQ